MADPQEKRTSEKYIAPPHWEFVDPTDIQKDCKCEKDCESGKEGWHKCTKGAKCTEAGGKCRLVLAAPGEPQLRLWAEDKEKNVADEDDTWVTPRAPGWELFCACLKHTGKDPTEEEKKKWPPRPKWVPPEGYKLDEEGDPCNEPSSPPGADRSFRCGRGCYLVGVSKKGELQLEVLAGPEQKWTPGPSQHYWAVFCIRLKKA